MPISKLNNQLALNIAITIMLVFSLASCASCASCASMKNTNEDEVFQRISVGSEGSGIVRNPKIQYGKLTIPGGTNMQEIPPIHGTLSSESRVVPIPSFANVSWYSEDGSFHQVSVPILSSIKDKDHFVGFKFNFVDNYLNVYLITKIDHKNTKYLDTRNDLVFSSRKN